MGGIQAPEEGQDSGWEDGKAKVGQPSSDAVQWKVAMLMSGWELDKL